MMIKKLLILTILFVATAFVDTVHAQTPTYANNGAGCAITQVVGGPADAVVQYNCPLPNPTGAGNLLVLWVRYNNQNSPNLTFKTNLGALTMTQATTCTDSTHNNTVSRLYYAANIPAGISVVNVVFSANSSYVDAQPYEFYDVATGGGSATLDAATCQVTSGTSISSGALPTLTSGDLIVHFGMSDNGGTTNPLIASCSVGTTPTGLAWTMRAALISGPEPMCFQYGVYNGTAGFSPTMTFGTSVTGAISLSAAFKAASAGTPPPPGIRVVYIQHDDGNEESNNLANFNAQLPISGNLAVEMTTVGCSGAAISTCNHATSMADGTNTWNIVSGQYLCTFLDGGHAAAGSIWYAKVGTPGLYPLVAQTKAQAQTGRNFLLSYLMFDIAGADPVNPIDLNFGGAGTGLASISTQNNGGPLNPEVTFTATPSRQNEVILAQAGYDWDTFVVDPTTGDMTSPAGGHFVSGNYLNETNYSVDDLNGGWGMYYNGASTAAETWTWAHDNSSNQGGVGRGVGMGVAIQSAPDVDLPGWHEVPYSSLSGASQNGKYTNTAPCPPNNYWNSLNLSPQPIGYQNCQKIVTAFSSSIPDPVQNRFILWGGGHNDVGNNEVYAIDLSKTGTSSTNPAIVLVAEPDPPNPYVGSDVEALSTNGVPGWTTSWTSGGSQRPGSRHTGLSGLLYLPDQDQMASFGGSLNELGNCGDAGVFTNPTTNITAITESGTTVTVTSSFVPTVNQHVHISGVTPGGYNGVYKVLTVGGGQFTYTSQSSGLAAGAPISGFSMTVQPGTDSCWIWTLGLGSIPTSGAAAATVGGAPNGPGKSTNVPVWANTTSIFPIINETTYDPAMRLVYGLPNIQGSASGPYSWDPANPTAAAIQLASNSLVGNSPELVDDPDDRILIYLGSAITLSDNCGVSYMTLPGSSFTGANYSIQFPNGCNVTGPLPGCPTFATAGAGTWFGNADSNPFGTNGGGASNNSYWPGVAWDPIERRVILLGGASTNVVYLLDPKTWTCTSENYGATNGVDRPYDQPIMQLASCAGAWVAGHFNYLASLGQFAYIAPYGGTASSGSTCTVSAPSSSIDDLWTLKRREGGWDLLNKTASGTNAALTIPGEFIQGEYEQCVVPYVNGTQLAANTYQTDVKKRWPDGSLAVAVISFVLPSWTQNVPVLVRLENTLSCNNTGQETLASMLANYGFDGQIVINDTTTGTHPHTISANAILTAASSCADPGNDVDGTVGGNLCTYWLKGPVVTGVIIESRNARTYDVNIDGNTGTPLHPIFEAWFYPLTHQTQLGYTLEDSWASTTATSSARDQTYSLTITGGTAHTSLYTQASVPQTARTRWHKTYCFNSSGTLIGANTCNPNFHIDHRWPYLAETKMWPHWDTHLQLQPSLIAGVQNSYATSACGAACTNNIGGNSNGVVTINKGINGTGDASWIGPFQTVDVVYMLSQCDSVTSTLASCGNGSNGDVLTAMLGTADLAGAIPYFYREADPTPGHGLYFDAPAGTTAAQGRVVSINARTQVTLDDPTTQGGCNSNFSQDWINLGGAGGSGQNGWNTDTSHWPNLAYTSYLITGQYAYYEEQIMQTAYAIADSTGSRACDIPGGGSSQQRGGAKGYWISDQERQQTWTARENLYGAYLAMNGSPEKAYFEDKLLGNLAVWEGSHGITCDIPGTGVQQPYCGATNTYYAFGTGRRTGNPWSGTTLGMWTSGFCSSVGPTIGCYVESPLNTSGPNEPSSANAGFQNGFSSWIIGMMNEYGYCPGNCALLNFVANFYINMALNPATNIYHFEEFVYPTSDNSGAASNTFGGQITSWTEFETFYAAQPRGFPECSGATIDQGYVQIGSAALSLMTNIISSQGSYSGLAAYNKVRALMNCINDSTSGSGGDFASGSPKWDFTPHRTYGLYQGSTFIPPPYWNPPSRNQVTPPNFGPVGGSYTGTQTVFITTTTQTNQICYTTDGTTPTSNGNGSCTHGTTITPVSGVGGQGAAIYGGTISVSAPSTTVKALGTMTGKMDSFISTAQYTIGGGGGQANAPTFSLAAGAYPGTQSVTISTTTAGAILCWNTTGSPATNGSGTGCTTGTFINGTSGSISVSATETVYAVAGASTLSDSSVSSIAYTIVTSGCGGSGLSWACVAGATTAQIQATINSAASSPGAVVLFGVGTYTPTGALVLQGSGGPALQGGITLQCQTAAPTQGGAVSGCLFNLGTLGFANITNYTDINDALIRISGFVFTFSSQGQALNWGSGCASTCYGTFTRIRVDHNTWIMTNSANPGVSLMIQGASGSFSHFYGVIDHNLFCGAGMIGACAAYAGIATGQAPGAEALYHFGNSDPLPPPNPQGTINNLFLEDNQMLFQPISNDGGANNVACTDSHGDPAYVVRNNTFVDCVLTTHAVAYGGGAISYEMYNNNMTADTHMQAGQFQACYRMYHNQGAGLYLNFNNTFTCATTPQADIQEFFYGYRAGFENLFAGTAAYSYPYESVCDGRFKPYPIQDGTRTPISAFRGYPCYHQPGRDQYANLFPGYSWNSTANSTFIRNLYLDNFTTPYGATHLQANRDIYTATTTIQTALNVPWDCAPGTGMGFGPIAFRPTDCPTYTGEAGGGPAYFATDQGTAGILYQYGSGGWKQVYQPYIYPHPLVSGSSPIVATPLMSPIAGAYLANQNVTITDSNPSATIWYTINGKVPTCASPSIPYTTPIPVTSTEVINAVACASGYVQSYTNSAGYFINATLPPPILSALPGTYPSAASSLTIQIPQVYQPFSKVCVTVDGTTPGGANGVCSGTSFGNPVNSSFINWCGGAPAPACSSLTSPVTVKAINIPVNGTSYIQSPVVSGVFNLVGTNALWTVPGVGQTADFGMQAVNTQSDDYLIEITNDCVNAGVQCSTTATSITSIAITGPFADDGTGSCVVGGTYSLTPGQLCEVAVVFKPTAFGVANGTLVITDNAPTPGTQHVVNLTGVGGSGGGVTGTGKISISGTVVVQ